VLSPWTSPTGSTSRASLVFLCEDENALTDLDCDVNIIVDGMHGGASVLHTRLVACSPRYTDGHAAATDSLPLMAVRTPHALTLWCTSGSLRHARVVLSERATHVTYCSTRLGSTACAAH
jgi:hypothetical protein